MKRIAYLDMLRGYALVCIMLDHMPGSVLKDGTLANIALFDAAELFVLLSGFLVGLVWMQVRARDGERAAQKRFLRRAFQVWRALVIGAVAMAALSALLWHLDLRHTAIWAEYSQMLVENPFGYAATVALLWLQPNLLDVLALYVVLIATVPLTMPALTRWPVQFALASALLWMVAVPLNAALPGQRVEGGFLFNPFGWQVLFFVGAAIGAYRAEVMQSLLPWRRLLTAASIAILVFGAAYDLLVHLGPAAGRLRGAMGLLVEPIDKWSLDEARLISILAASWLVATVLSRPLAALADTVIGRALAEIGRGGLWSFIAGVLLSVSADAVQMTISKQHSLQRALVDIGAILVLWALAALWMRRAEWLPHLPALRRPSRRAGPAE